MPAFKAHSTPLGVSSNTIQSEGAKSSIWAHFKKVSGSGLLFLTLFALTIASK